MKIKIVLITCCLFFSAARAFDIPMYYRAPFFPEAPTKKTQKWATTLLVRGATGDTHRSYDQHEHKTELFNAHGAFETARLGLNLDNLEANKIAKPKTYYYWSTNSSSIGKFTDPKNPLVATDGQVVFNGHFETTELDVELKQNLFWGLYAHVYMPFKELKVDELSYKNIGAAAVNGVNIDNYLKNDLPLILQENGYAKMTAITDPWKKSGLGDLVVSLGWHGYKDGLQDKLVKGYAGFVQIGVICPISDDRDDNIIFAIPLGYNGHWGINMQLGIEGTLWSKMLTLGAQAGATAFFTKEYAMRLRTDKSQNGWMTLGKGNADEDEGSLWNAGVYIKCDEPIAGLNVYAGGSFTFQETRGLHVEDASFLKDYIAAQNVSGQYQSTGNPATPFVSQDDIAGSDKRLFYWETFTAHLLLSYDLSHAMHKTWGPILKVAYDYPFYGKLTFPVDMYSGTLGFSVAWNF
jgi:hypothetical protein